MMQDLLRITAVLVLSVLSFAAQGSLPPNLAKEAAQEPNPYERVLQSAERVETPAHELMPESIWFFDRERDRNRLNEMQAAAGALRRDQVAFEDKLSPEQLSRFDSQVHSLHQLRAELGCRIESLDQELRKRTPERSRLAPTAPPLPS